MLVRKKIFKVLTRTKGGKVVRLLPAEISFLLPARQCAEIAYLDARRVGCRKWQWGFALIGNQVRWHSVNNMRSDMSVKASTALPVFHLSPVPELFCDVIDPILPFVEIHATEAASRLYERDFCLPRIHTRSHLATVPDCNM